MGRNIIHRIPRSVVLDRNRREIEGDAIGVGEMKIVYLDGKKRRKPQKLHKKPTEDGKDYILL